MIGLETSTQGSLITAIFLLCIGIPALSLGLHQRYKATPDFVASYRGGTSTALGLPFGGAAAIAMAVFTLAPQPPRILGQILGLIWVASMPVWLSSFLIRFPRPDLSQLRLGSCLWIVLVLVRAFWVRRVGH